MFTFCVLFGVAMIANTQQAGDGGWFWYATLLHGGKRLYADMHLALQPLFVLETASFLELMGNGWLVSKIPAVLHLVAYCLGLLLLCRYSDLSDRQKALFLGCGFFISIAFEGYRFDDYHVLADCFEVYSLVALLMLQNSGSALRTLSLAAGLGILCGLSITTRLNDGAALVVGVVIAIFFLAPSRKLLSIFLFSLTAALTAIVVVHLTGDSLHDYAMYSIFKAAGSKGGAGNVLAYPLRLPLNTLLWLKSRWHAELIIYSFAVSFILVFLVHHRLRTRAIGDFKTTFGKALLGFLLILLPLYHLYPALLDGDFLVSLSAVGTLAAYVLGVLVVLRSFRWQLRPDKRPAWNRREILLLIPLGQLASASMSSGGRHVGLYGPLAVMIVLLPVASPIQLKRDSTRSVLLALVALLIFFGIVYKALIPYSWHSYRAAPLFVGRQWYHHPVYGPMIIDTRQLNFIESVCGQVAASDSPRELLSLPYSYANYFCSVPPWHDYVQTFFDTSSKATIFGLMQELQQSPPKWVLYQQQLDSLALHEVIYGNGEPLPHRQLDHMIQQKLASGKWRTVYTSTYGDRPGWSNEWFLIRTRP
jgi:hypothetical protein